jgi:hypothetical protein
LRGQFNIAQGMVNWTVGGFRALNTNDILPISSPLVGHEFFQNAGNTLRQGIEANVNYKQDRWNIYANYTYVDATFQNALTLQSPFNPFADANGNIFVVPGDHIPGIPDFRFKRRIPDNQALEIRSGFERHRQSMAGRRPIKPEPETAGLLGRQSAFLLPGHGERRGIRTRAQSVRSALFRVWNVL